MRRYRFFLLVFCFILFQNIPLSGHTYRIPIIIDTDMALDDARALVMLLNQDMCNVLLTVTSDGAVSPETGCRNLKQLFARLDKEDINVAIGRNLHENPPPWRSWTEKIFSFDKPDVPLKKVKSQPAAEAIVNVLHASGTSSDVPCIYLCLGPLTNLADALKMDAGIKDKISRVIYYGTTPFDPKLDWNTNRDLPSAQRVFRSGLMIFTFSHSKIKDAPFDKRFFEKIKTLDTPASRFFITLHTHPTIKRLLSQGHFRIWDEMTVIYLNRPDLFQFTQQGSNIFTIKGYETAAIYSSYLKLLGYSADSHLVEREVVVLKDFPTNPFLFKPDVTPFVKKIIGKYGLEEWKACVLTNELHRHLGIYSIIGAKMGIRAREILEAPLDSLEVLSFAGSKPPLSCLNDGLQVSTGASLGRGTIKISVSSPQPAAEFIFKDEKLTLRVRDEILQRIKKDIQSALKTYGGLGPEYFAHIRRLSIRYWYELDRMKIFDQVGY